MAAVLAVLLLGTVLVSQATNAQSGDDLAEQVRIVARKLADGRIEFGLQQHRDGSWSERLLPARRLFPADTTAGRWLQSSPLTTSVAASPYVTPSDVRMRIVARRLADGRTEFGLQLRQYDTTWGERLEPAGRMFPADTDAGRWLVSTPLTANLPPRAAKNYELPPGSAGLVDIRVSGLEVCGRHADGTVTCWGSDNWTQCVPGHDYCSLTPLDTETFEPEGVFTAIAAGQTFYGLRADGTVTCWTGNTHVGSCDPLSDGIVMAISANGYDACGLRSDGTVTCWGRD